MKNLLLFLALAISPSAVADEAAVTRLWAQESGCSESIFLRDNSIVDCMTNLYAQELDFGEGLKPYQCVGQALHYAELSGLKPQCILIRKEGYTDEQWRKAHFRAASHDKVQIICIDETAHIIHC